LLDRYGRVLETVSAISRRFGLCSATAAQTTRDVIVTRDMRRRVSSAGAAFANRKVQD
jgi:hypothetical protein